MNREFAERFAREWVETWNRHDLDAIMAHYADDFEMHSPVIRQLAGAPDGRLKGKPDVRAYWEKALALVPELHFELIRVFTGANSLIIQYKGHRGLSSEMFVFNNEGLVQAAHAHYE